MRKLKKLASLFLAGTILLSSFSLTALAADSSGTDAGYLIVNPYADVNWNNDNQFNAALHWHTWNSDGSTTLANMVETHYNHDYDVIGTFDHDYVTVEWDVNGFGRGPGNNNPGRLENNGQTMLMTTERRLEIEAGADRDGRGMINITNSNEQSATQHINTLWAPFNNVPRGSRTPDEQMRLTFDTAESHGGLSFINHPGRETGGSAGGNNGANGSRNHAQRYIDLFMDYSVESLVGMEIVNRLDNESRSDRILWDYILSATMPQGRPVWGLSNDDAHSMAEVGYNNNVMLMSDLSQESFRTAIETGAFYATAPVARREGVNATYPDGSAMRSGGGNASTEYLRDINALPVISNIAVDGNTITIEGEQYETVEWVSGIEYVGGIPQSRVIATGNSIDVSQYPEIAENAYVRAQLKGDNGIAFTNPFGVTVYNLIVEANASTVKAGESFGVNISFEEAVESNTAILNVNFDTNKFAFNNFYAADGVTLLNTVYTTTGVTLTVMVPDYATSSYGEIRLTAKADADLKDDDSSISVAAAFVLRDANSEKFMMYAAGSTGLFIGEITEMSLIDLSNVIDGFGVARGDADWSKYSRYDINNNGVIDIFDIVHFAKLVK